MSKVPPDSEKLELVRAIEQLQGIIESQRRQLVEQERLIAELRAKDVREERREGS
jgi:hypothetical protein